MYKITGSNRTLNKTHNMRRYKIVVLGEKSYANVHKYPNVVANVDNYNDIIVRIINDNQKVCGTRKIRHSLTKQGICICIMKFKEFQKNT